MENTITIALTPEGNLELPPGIREQFANGEQYLVVKTEDSIIFKKNPISSSSIWNLGSNPVECDVKDGAINHDRYLYD